MSLRNKLVGGEFVLTTSGAGMNFYVGNHPSATGIYESVPFLTSAEPQHERADFLREAERRSGRRLTPSESSRFWLGEGLRFVLDQPGAYLRLLGRKLFMFWHRVESQNNLSYYFAEDFVPLLRLLALGWGVIAPLGLAGLLLSRGHPLLLSLYLGAYLAGCLFFFVSSEYRLPVAPVLMVHAARLLVGAHTWLATRQFRQALWPVALAAVLAVPVNYPDGLTRRLTSRRIDYYNFGKLYERQEALGKAEGMYRKALGIDAQFAVVYRALAGVYRKQGRQDAALWAQQRADALEGSGQRGIGTQVQLALKAFSEGAYEEAAAHFEAVIEAGDAQAEHYNNLGLCHYRMGRFSEAEAAYRKAIALQPGYDKAHYNLALIYMERKEEGTAEIALRRVLELSSEHLKARYRLGELYVRAGRYSEAREQWMRVLQAVPEDRRLKASIDSVTALMGSMRE